VDLRLPKVGGGYTHTLIWGFIQNLAGGTEEKSENLQSGLSVLVRSLNTDMLASERNSQIHS